MATITSTFSTPAGKNVNGYVYNVSDISTVLSSTANTLASSAISHELGQKKVLVAFEVTTAFAGVTPNFIMQGSFDGTTWVALATVATLSSVGSTGIQAYLVDLSSIYAPYYRLAINTAGGVNLGTSGKGRFHYATKVNTDID